MKLSPLPCSQGSFIIPIFLNPEKEVNDFEKLLSVCVIGKAHGIYREITALDYQCQNQTRGDL